MQPFATAVQSYTVVILIVALDTLHLRMCAAVVNAASTITLHLYFA